LLFNYVSTYNFHIGNMFTTQCAFIARFSITGILMTQAISKTKVRHIQSATELGRYLRDCRHEQASTISEASSFAALGERFISEVERGKQTASFDKTLQYLTLLGLSLQIYPRNVLSIESPYGAFTDLKAIGTLARHHRKAQKATLEMVMELSGLSLRFLSDFERGKNCQIGNALSALKSYGLEVAIAPRGYRLSKAELLNV
jgi:HTH-type transcriptional regulator / antitoxin HipB